MTYAVKFTFEIGVNMDAQAKVIVIVGPTAVGKTALSIEIARRFNGEIVSGDSMQIYRGLSIGTAKASAEEQALASHHLIDVANPEEQFSVAQFVAMAKKEIAEIIDRGHLPIIVGGTGFYVQALLGDRPLADIKFELPEQEVLAWTNRARKEGEQVVRDALAQLDPISAERILPGQTRRLVRALLVSKHSGKPFSTMRPERQRNYDAFVIGLNTERTLLHERINERVNLMMETGLLDEARLVKKLPDRSTAKMAIGYKELFPYLDGAITLDEASENLKTASRRYAKRQLTWFNNQFDDIHWYNLVEHKGDLQRIIDDLKEFVS